MHRTFLLATAAAALTLGAAAPAEAALRALVVGINDYVGAPKLKGAVNDADDVASVLGKAGIEVIKLVDAEATRAKTFAAYSSLIAKSTQGDIIYFHFAGHGVPLPDDNGDEANDKQDEAYLFRDFKAMGDPDIVVDDELAAWFAMAGAKGVKVVFVADACHSGSPTRSSFSAQLPTRLFKPKTKIERPPPLVTMAAAAEGPPFVTSVGATEDNRTVPELPIEEKPRGALSYAVARAFEGAGDKDKNGDITAAEFTAYLQATVRNLAASKQTPQFEVPEGGLPLLASRQLVVVADPPTGMGLYFRPGADPAYEAAVKGLDFVHLSPEEAGATLVYDPASTSLINKAGDVVAAKLDAAGLVFAIEAQHTLEAFNAFAQAGSMLVSYTPGDERHKTGTRITFDVPEAAGKYVTAFDLTGEGTVQYIWPLKGDADPLPPKRPFFMEADVSPPFGADNLIILATDEPPTEFRTALTAMNGKKAPKELHDAFKAAVAGKPYKLGIQAFFTEE